MGWTPYPTAYPVNWPQSGQDGQGASSLLPYSYGQLNDPNLPQSILDQRQVAQGAMAAATSTAPYSSGLVTGLKALSGYVGGQAQAQADQAASSYAGQGGGSGQASPSLLGALLRGGAPSPTSSGQDDGSVPPATGWAGVGQAAGQGISQAAQALGRKSDRRLKSDVVRVGTLACGLPLYAYRLEGSPLFEVGCMADEVALVRPDATWFDPGDGWARVDYKRLI